MHWLSLYMDQALVPSRGLASGIHASILGFTLLHKSYQLNRFVRHP